VPDRDVVVRGEEIERVVAAVAPFVIPDDLVDAWLRVGATDWLIDAGEFQSPQSALESWGSMTTPQGMPRPLFPIAYASHTFLFVELSAPGGPPGGALLMAPIAEPLIRHAPSLAWAFDQVSSKLEKGAVGWDGTNWTGWDEVERDLQAKAALESWPPHLLPAIDPSLPLTWPSHWQEANGIDPAGATPLGANASVQDLFALHPGESRRIQVRVVALAGNAVGSRAGVADNSAEAVVWIPRAADPFWAVRIRDQVELEVDMAEPDVQSDLHPMVAMFDANSYRFRATMARPRQGRAVAPRKSRSRPILKSEPSDPPNWSEFAVT
jgi:hypothetical protein